MLLFGGCTGATIQTGTDTSHTALFDTTSGSWAVDASGGVRPPAVRSHHAMASNGDVADVFGGCGDAGRLNDVNQFDTRAQTQRAQLAAASATAADSSAPAGRGGAGIVVGDGGRALRVLFGFNSARCDDEWMFDLSARQWRGVDRTPDTPGARSVFACAQRRNGGDAVLLGGEREPSALGHEGAGLFDNNVSVLRVDGTWRGASAADVW